MYPLRLPTPRVISGTPANFSGFSRRQAPLWLALYPQLLAAPSGGHCANISGGPQISPGVGGAGG